MKKVFSFLLVSLILLQVFALPVDVRAKTIIQWGDAKDSEYNNLHPFTFLWSGDVFSDIGQGLNLKTLELTKNKDEMDIVFNQYGKMASHGVVEIKQELQADTDIDNYKTFDSTADLGEDKVYLIKTADKSYAKIKIHKFTSDKVTFSFVLPGSTKKEETSQSTTQAVTGANTQPKSTTQSPGTIETASDASYVIIQLQIADNVALVNGIEEIMDIPPMIIRNQPMVPLRLLSETFNANYRWRPLFRKVVLQHELKTFIFGLNKNFIKINNKKVFIDGSVSIVEKNIMVPLDLIKKVFGKEVIYSPEDRIIQILENITQTSASVEPSKDEDDEGQGIEFLYGKWSLWIPGGIIYTSDATNQYREYIPGAGGQTLEIKKNGTYIWKLYDETIKGEWSIDNENIYIPKGDYGWEWYVKEYDFDDYKGIKVFTSGIWRDGKRIK